MGSKNNPKNRVKSQKKEYNGQEVTPALYMDAAAEVSGTGEKTARRMLVAQYVKSRKLATDANGKPLAWNAV